jgi:L-ascorbate metabolism protein UlaG (beta-lactamase superfamily)
MKKTLLLFSLILVGTAHAQVDQIKTSIGDLTIHPITHGTLVLEINDLTIYVDPYGGEERFDGISDPDLVLITDIHGDHLNQKTLDGLTLDAAAFIVPQAVADKLPADFQERVTVLANGNATNWNGLTIRAIPMYNLPEDETSRHIKGRGNGYIISVGETQVYLSGDTEDIPEMRALKEIDIAFICMNLPYTMSVAQAADAVIEFQPSIVYPYHYRGKDGLSDVGQFKTLVDEANTSIEVRLREWYK